MSTFNEFKINRQSAGTSTGGQFAHKDHPADDSVGLGGVEDDLLTEDDVLRAVEGSGLAYTYYSDGTLSLTEGDLGTMYDIAVDDNVTEDELMDQIASQLESYNADEQFDSYQASVAQSPTDYAARLKETERRFHAKARELRGFPPKPEESETDKILTAFRNLSEDEQRTVETSIARRRALKAAVEANRWSEDLPEWPGDLSEPTVYTELSDADLTDIEVYVSWEKDGVSDGMTFYKTPYGTYSNLGSEDHPDSPGTVQLDPETRAQVEEYAEAAWKRADDLYGELAATSLNDNRDIISHFAQNKL